MPWFQAPPCSAIMRLPRGRVKAGGRVATKWSWSKEGGLQRMRPRGLRGLGEEEDGDDDPATTVLVVVFWEEEGLWSDTRAVSKLLMAFGLESGSSGVNVWRCCDALGSKSGSVSYVPSVVSVLMVSFESNKEFVR
jgi:hypothetical protein